MLEQTNAKRKLDHRGARDHRHRVAHDHRVRRRCCHCGVQLNAAITGTRLAAKQYAAHPLPHCAPVGFFGMRRAGLVTGRFKKSVADVLSEYAWLCWDERGREVTALELAGSLNN